MEIQTLKGEQRRAAGSREAARLRRRGRLPGVLYGHKIDPQSVSLDRHAVELQLQQGAHLVNLELAGAVQACLIKDVQYNHLGSELFHVDLARVDLNERVKVRVHLDLRGTAKGAAEGGVLRQELAEMEIECRVSAIPASIRVNVADMVLDQVLFVKDIPLEEGIVAVSEPDSVVATLRIPQAKAAIIEAVVGGAPTTAEPEVISKGKKEEEGAEGEAK